MAQKTKRTIIRESIAKAVSLADDDYRVLQAADEIIARFPEIQEPKPTAQGFSINAEVFQFYQDNFELLTGYNAQKISDAIDAYTAAWVLDAFKLCVDHGKKSLAYAEGILRRWKREGKQEQRKAYVIPSVSIKQGEFDPAESF